MKRFIQQYWLILAFFVFAMYAAAQVTGCAPLASMGEAMLEPPVNSKQAQAISELKDEQVRLQSILNDKTASEVDKKVADLALKVNQREQQATTQQAGQGNSPLEELLYTLGGFIPGATAGGVLLQMLRRYKTAFQQTVNGINDAHPTGLPEPLKQALASSQDQATKELVAETK